MIESWLWMEREEREDKGTPGVRPQVQKTHSAVTHTHTAVVESTHIARMVHEVNVLNILCARTVAAAREH